VGIGEAEDLADATISRNVGGGAVTRIPCNSCGNSVVQGVNFCGNCGNPMVQRTAEQRLDQIYQMCAMYGTCFELDPGMKGNFEMDRAWNSAQASAVKAGCSHPVARARNDLNYLVTQLNNESIGPGFVRVCQGIWNSFKDADRDAIIQNYCELARQKRSEGHAWFVPLLLKYDADLLMMMIMMGWCR
jgi:predicted RNA-binding Zn-ribbon protein involved in translation (DUF1610 family)